MEFTQLNELRIPDVSQTTGFILGYALKAVHGEALNDASDRITTSAFRCKAARRGQ
jgi:hypothetical protein